MKQIGMTPIQLPQPPQPSFLPLDEFLKLVEGWGSIQAPPDPNSSLSLPYKEEVDLDLAQADPDPPSCWEEGDWGSFTLDDYEK